MGEIANRANSEKTILHLRGQEILTFERQIDFCSIIESETPSVLFLKQQDYDSLYDFVTACATNFLKLCYPNQVQIAPVIASDLIETRPTWRAADFPNLFKFFRQRQDIEGLRVMGNQITIPKIMEMVVIYEEHRAAEVERQRAKQKGEITTKNDKLNELSQRVAGKFKDRDVVVNDLGMGKDYERAASEREQSGKNVLYPKQNHQQFFEK